MDEKYNDFFTYCNDLVQRFHVEIAEKLVKEILGEIEFRARAGNREYITPPMKRDVVILIIQHQVFSKFKIMILNGYTSMDSVVSSANYMNSVPLSRALTDDMIERMQPFIDVRFRW